MSNHRIRSKSEGDTLRVGIIGEFVSAGIATIKPFATVRKNKRHHVVILIERTAHISFNAYSVV